MEWQQEEQNFGWSAAGLQSINLKACIPSHIHCMCLYSLTQNTCIATSIFSDAKAKTTAKTAKKKITKWINYVQKFHVSFSDRMLFFLLCQYFIGPDCIQITSVSFVCVCHTPTFSPISLSQYLCLSPINGGTKNVHLFMVLFCQSEKRTYALICWIPVGKWDQAIKLNNDKILRHFLCVGKKMKEWNFFGNISKFFLGRFLLN